MASAASELEALGKIIKVNIQAVAEIIGYSANRLKLKLENFSGEGLIVSRDNVSAFKQWMDR
jgi:hypothetical protein